LAVALAMLPMAVAMPMLSAAVHLRVPRWTVACPLPRRSWPLGPPRTNSGANEFDRLIGPELRIVAAGDRIMSQSLAVFATPWARGGRGPLDGFVDQCGNPLLTRVIDSMLVDESNRAAFA
jgi:hypothetical protein